MNKHIVISIDPLAEIRELVERVNRARAEMSHERREKSATEHAKRLAELEKMAERIQRREAEKARFLNMVNAYNAADPEERADFSTDWVADYRAKNGIETDAANDDHEAD